MNNASILKEIIEQRRSIFPKDYTDTEIPQEILEEILNAATFAPNHKRTKPWRFKIFKGKEKAQLASEMQAIYKAITPEQLFLEKKYNDIGFKINKADTLIYIKDAMHKPLICWTGDGYKITDSKEIVFQNQKIWFNKMEKNGIQYHSYWWYESGNKKYTSYVEVMWQKLLYNKPIRLINETIRVN